MSLKGWRLVMNRVIFIPQRYALGLLSLLVLTYSSMMRVSFSKIITQNTHPKISEPIVGGTCPDRNIVNNSMGINRLLNLSQLNYEWDDATQNLLISAFSYGYIITQLPGGILADRLGGKWVVVSGLLTTSIATVLIPLAADEGGALGLFIVRVICGLGEGLVTPALLLLLSRWVPPFERARFGAIVFGGVPLGAILGLNLSELFPTNDYGGANLFYCFGGIGVTLVIFWIFLCHNTPASHPFILDDEKQYLNTTVTAFAYKSGPIPFKALLRSASLWALVMVAVGHNWGYYVLTTDMPKYLSDIVKINFDETSLWSTQPYMAMFLCSFVFAWFCDCCIKKKWHSRTVGRKIYTTISSSIPAFCTIFLAYSGCNRALAVGLYIASMAFMSGAYSSVKINVLDIAPNYAGTSFAVVNGVAAASEISASYLVTVLAPDNTVDQWRIAFCWTVFTILIGTNLLYLVWGSGDQQWWDDVEVLGYPQNWTHGPLRKPKHRGKELVYPKHDHSPLACD